MRKSAPFGSSKKGEKEGEKGCRERQGEGVIKCGVLFAKRGRCLMNFGRDFFWKNIAFSTL